MKNKYFKENVLLVSVLRTLTFTLFLLIAVHPLERLGEGNSTGKFKEINQNIHMQESIDSQDEDSWDKGNGIIDMTKFGIDESAYCT